MTEEELEALWQRQRVRCVGNWESACGWRGRGAEITRFEDEYPVCPRCDEGVVENYATWWQRAWHGWRTFVGRVLRWRRTLIRRFWLTRGGSR